MSSLFLIGLFLYIISYAYSFRYQRVTLELSRALLGYGDRNIQSKLTPDWVNLISWFAHISHFILIFLAFYLFSWIWGIIILLYPLLGAVFIHYINPFPTRKQMHIIIRNKLENDIDSTNNIENRKILIHFLNDVDDLFLNYFKSIGRESDFYKNMGIE